MPILFNLTKKINSVTPAKTVLLYTDKLECEFDYSTDDLSIILQHFRTENWDLIHAKPTTGFESGVNWEELAREKNIVAVVLFGVSDACAYGTYAEARYTVGIPVYEILEGQLLELDDLEVSDKMPVLDLEKLLE